MRVGGGREVSERGLENYSRLVRNGEGFKKVGREGRELGFRYILINRET